MPANGFEARPKRQKKNPEAIRTVFIEKHGLPQQNQQLLAYQRQGYEITETSYGWDARISEAKYAAIEKAAQDKGMQNVQGTRNISDDERQEGMFRSTVDSLSPVSAEDLMETLSDDEGE